MANLGYKIYYDISIIFGLPANVFPNMYKKINDIIKPFNATILLGYNS